MISNQRATEDALALSRAVSGHGYQRVAFTVCEDGVALRVDARIDSHHGDGWAEAALSSADLAALRDWIDQIDAENSHERNS